MYVYIHYDVMSFCCFLLVQSYRVGQKTTIYYLLFSITIYITLLLSISLPIIDQFSKFFHLHTLQTIWITWLLHIPPHQKCVSTLPCEISEIYIYNDNNKPFGKIEKKTLQTNITVNGLYDTKLCGSNTV